MSVACLGGRSRIERLAESGPARLRIPRTEGAALEGVVINTAGGIACGDRFSVTAEAGAGARVILATATAEKVYRSDGPTSALAVQLSVGAGASLDWLPQETILYDRARLSRRIEADLAPDAQLLICESLVFGRQAKGERVEHGFIEDVWRIRRGGRLVYADSLRIDGRVAALLDRPAVAGGAGALATMLYVAPDAEARLDEARDHLADGASECGASAWQGLLAVRLLAPAIDILRRDMARFLTRFRGCSLPRVWQT